jgi:hypothetical protein
VPYINRLNQTKKRNKTRTKINKLKATLTGRSPPTHLSRAPRRYPTKPGVDIRAAKGERHVMCEII